MDSEVTFNEDKTGADISLNIKEGPRTTVRSIVITGLTVLPEAKARQALVHKIGDPFRTAALDAEKEAIASLVSEKGYPHATVHASVTYSQDRSQADILHDVDAGPLVILEDIFVSGNLLTAEKVIRRELEVKPQTPLSLRSIYDGQRRLRDLDIFHGVSYRTFGLKEKAESELVPDDQLFFLGGIQNVRGFKENLHRFDSQANPVGGKTAVVGSLEARIDMGMN